MAGETGVSQTDQALGSFQRWFFIQPEGEDFSEVELQVKEVIKLSAIAAGKQPFCFLGPPPLF
jgi:hypothetical protein